jgi:hypothetical protein
LKKRELNSFIFLFNSLDYILAPSNSFTRTLETLSLPQTCWVCIWMTFKSS